MENNIKDDRIRFFYDDKLREDGSSSEIESITDLLNSIAVGDTGVLEVTKPVYVVDSVMIKVFDADLNENATEEESVSVVVSNSFSREAVFSLSSTRFEKAACRSCDSRSIADSKRAAINENSKSWLNFTRPSKRAASRFMFDGVELLFFFLAFPIESSASVGLRLR